MIFSSTAQYLSFFLSFTIASAMVPRPMVGRASVNGTSSSTTSSVLQSAATTSSVDMSTITTAPTSNSIYSDPLCATAGSDYCRVDVGTVQYGRTPFPSYNYTMTSPISVFCHRQNARNRRLQKIVGPVLTDFVTGYPLSLVSTLAPYAETALTATRINNSTMQLQLSDLSTNCPLFTTIPHDNHNVGNNGCNAVFAYDYNLMGAGGDAWKHCGRHAGGHYGIYDPPVPVQACLDSNCGDEGAGSAATTTASQEPTTPFADLKAPTSSVAASPSPAISTGPSSTALAVPTISTASETPTSEVPTGDGNAPAYQVASTTGSTSTPTSIIIAPSEQLSSSAPLESTSPAPGAIITLANSAVISATAGASSVVIGSQTVYAHSAAITVSGEGVVGLSPSGLVISNSINGVVSTYPLPAPATNQIPPQIYTYAGHSISVAGVGSSKAVIGKPNVDCWGDVATLSGNQVVSLAATGLVVQAPGGEATTIPIHASTTAAGGGQSLTTGSSSGNASSTIASTTSLGAIIYSLQGDGRRSIESGILSWISGLIFGAVLILR